VCFFNRNTTPWALQINWAELGFAGDYAVRDLWQHKQTGRTSEAYKTTLPAHSVLLVRLSRIQKSPRK
jgi:hypothetical protein